MSVGVHRRCGVDRTRLDARRDDDGRRGDCERAAGGDGAKSTVTLKDRAVARGLPGQAAGAPEDTAVSADPLCQVFAL